MKRTLELANLQFMHSFRLPAKANKIIYLKDISELSSLPSDAYILGAGSNTVFLEDFERPIVKVELQGICIQESASDWLVTVGAGENWHQLVCKLMERGVFGFENMALIPGTVGAAPVQNIGAYGREIADFIKTVQAWHLGRKELVTLTQSDCKFAYRDSLFKREAGDWIITEVCFAIPKQWEPEISYGELRQLQQPITAKAIFDAVISTRQRKLPDPDLVPNAGSFFKNPVVSQRKLTTLLDEHPNMPYFTVSEGTFKLAAGWLIDALGLKGFQHGGAAVHRHQALVLINAGNATGTDVVALAKYIQAEIRNVYGVELEPEVRLLGAKGLIAL